MAACFCELSMRSKVGLSCTSPKAEIGCKTSFAVHVSPAAPEGGPISKYWDVASLVCVLFRSFLYMFLYDDKSVLVRSMVGSLYCI